MARLGDIVTVKDFPMANGGVAKLKFGLVINHPDRFGGDAIIIELTTQSDRDLNDISPNDIVDTNRRTAKNVYVYPIGKSLQLKGTFAQISLARKPRIWACLSEDSFEKINERAWQILQVSK